MRLKNIIKLLHRGAAGLCIVSCALGMTGCADMLQHDDDLTMTVDENSLSTPNDTIYSVAGVITLMQRVADRTNLLGEMRSDMVQYTTDATTYLKNLADYRLDQIGPYNTVADYYAIINNCNYYINTVDTAYSKRGQSVFKKEYVVMKAYRAWTYLQLVLNYGQVPFYTHFLATEGDGQAVLAQPKRDLKFICDYFINDLAPYVETLMPDYGSLGGYRSDKYFFPVRVLLGDMCLYSERYREAAQYYHDFLAHRDNPRPLSARNVEWRVESPTAVGGIISSYSSQFRIGVDECLTGIPMEYSEADGLVSDLTNIYCSTTKNYYHFQVAPSEALYSLSAAQNYCFTYVDETTQQRDTIIATPGYLKDFTAANRALEGDLRLYDVVTRAAFPQYAGTDFSTSYQDISKISSSGLPVYRLSHVYLRYAEALNRAGFPSAAMVVLKYGVCPDNITDYVTQYEKENAGTLLTFSQYYFDKSQVKGMHARGCGQAECDTTYILPMPDKSLPTIQDTIEYQIPLVEQMIMDEAALECCFEGTRFNDLQRMALRLNQPSYLAERVAMRSGTRDDELYNRLLDKANWYLPLP